MTIIPNVLSIAGSDPSGGAGIQADLKTFSALGCYGMAVVTALTAQNTKGVFDVYELPADFVEKQIVTIFEDIRVDAVKIGMLANADIVEVVASVLTRFKPAHVVLDPVMVASSGDTLLSADSIAIMKECLIPLSSILTPNIPEAEKLSRKAVLDLETAAVDLLQYGSDAVFLKGGHLKGEVARDILAFGDEIHIYDADRFDIKDVHGTGCTLSSALASYCAKGFNLKDSCALAKDYITGAIHAIDGLSVGKGHPPTDHGWRSRHAG